MHMCIFWHQKLYVHKFEYDNAGYFVENYYK